MATDNWVGTYWDKPKVISSTASENSVNTCAPQKTPRGTVSKTGHTYKFISHRSTTWMMMGWFKPNKPLGYHYRGKPNRNNDVTPKAPRQRRWKMMGIICQTVQCTSIEPASTNILDATHVTSLWQEPTPQNVPHPTMPRRHASIWNHPTMPTPPCCSRIF